MVSEKHTINLETPAAIAISVIIVNYKTPQLLFDCVESVFSTKHMAGIEIIVVDNNSGDNSKDLVLSAYPSVKWIQLSYNSGFSRGNNAGIREANGDYILLLNSDTVVKDGFFDTLLASYKLNDASDKLGLLGCRIKSPEDDSLLIGSGKGFFGIGKIIKQNPLYIYLTRSFSSQKNDYDPYTSHYTNHEVDFVSGACVMIKKSKIVKDALYLDEDFFLYYEDLEWSYRVKNKGFFNYFCGDAEVYHLNCGSSPDNSKKKFQIQVSSYLFLFKTSGNLLYSFTGWLIKMNYILSIYLQQRKNEDITIQAKEYEVFKKYYYLVPGNFNKSKPSLLYLIYD